MNALVVLFIIFISVCLCDTSELSICCQFSHLAEDILRCGNQSATRQYNGFLDRTASERAQPSLTIAMLTRMTPSIVNYSAYSYLIHAKYAEQNSYVLLPLRHDSRQTDYIYHRKLVPILDTLFDMALNADYIVWFDADLIPLDLAYRVEEIIFMRPSAHIYMSADVSSLANTGFIVVRNSLWTRSFLRDWLALRDQPGIQTEQLGFDALYRTRDAGEMRQKVAILPAHVMNSIAAPMGEQQPHHKILHLAAESTALRAAVLRAAAQEVCAALVREERPVKPQLGVDRSFLQRTAVAIYGEAYKVLQNNLLIASVDAAAEDFAEYRAGVSKYSYAMSYVNDRTETRDTLRVRWQAHILGASLTLLRIFRLYTEAHKGTVAGTGIPEAVVLDSMHSERKAVELQLLSVAMVASTTSAALQRRKTLVALSPHGSCLIDDIMVVINAAAHRGLAQSPAGRGPEQAGDALRVLYGELPELLKLSAELSFELLQVLMGYRDHRGHRGHVVQRRASLPRDEGGAPVTAENSGADVVDVVTGAGVVHSALGNAGTGNAATGVQEDALWLEDPSVMCEVLGSVEFTLRVLRRVVHSSQVGIIESMQWDVAGVRDHVGGCE